MTELCRVLVADDDPMVREAYRMFLTRNDNHEVVGEARNGREAVEAYEELKPDVVLMDLQMPDMSGVDAIREINRKHRGACIVALTTFGTQEYIVSALRAGASGYLMKDCGGPALLTGIQQARDGEMPLAPGVRRELVADLLTGHPKILTDEAAAPARPTREGIADLAGPRHDQCPDSGQDVHLRRVREAIPVPHRRQDGAEVPHPDPGAGHSTGAR